MRKPTLPKKLSLSKETLQALSHAVGGLPTGSSFIWTAQDDCETK